MYEKQTQKPVLVAGQNTPAYNAQNSDQAKIELIK